MDAALRLYVRPSHDDGALHVYLEAVDPAGHVPYLTRFERGTVATPRRSVARAHVSSSRLS
jgi:hypothetical protein